MGVESGYDKELRGKAGVKSVVVNSQGYRQTENIWDPAEAGDTLVLTIDLKLQEKTEQALQMLYGPGTRGAAVVMNVETGDILALASSPTLNPNNYVLGLSLAEWAADQSAKGGEKSRDPGKLRAGIYFQNRGRIGRPGGGHRSKALNR